ncbi:UDP-N-acetylmuramate dehydrogenase [Tahibacter amnicola]|uniref:UDP-N-acetylenolpyruvoylglucosamine reductase n=1 Tax=Tahibacter amnicola TaxID=2976241 RepID=A0ABY6BK43_9GAMM|nr:UDP-N-acetylmuramate dehydrogenase [Tahibacter amnicola]UXI69763.1 UDP-N-acetylmuramate dehydrogenase [Tahibacter amnicola]
MSFTVAPARFDGPGYTILEDAALNGRNTFRVAARANLLVDVRDSTALAEVLAFPLVRSLPLLPLGEGSNLLFTRDFPGVVLNLGTRGINVLEDDGDSALLHVAAGESWNDLVHWTLAKGFSGLENLVLIPGMVGAAPIQNIGAYGVEVCDVIHAVEAYDRRQGCIVRLGNADCRFAYRDSCFKHEPDRWIVTAVVLRLPRQGTLRTDYAGIGDELARMGVATPTATLIAEAVTRLRRRKLPDPAVIGNAGSFFKNPIVEAGVAQALKAAHPGMPAWPAGADHCKLSAAWLIESAGLKGFRQGDAGVSEQHALVLVNHGSATGAQLWDVAQHVQAGVQARFGVLLEPEPRVL